jgi:hypothetical protein
VVLARHSIPENSKPLSETVVPLVIERGCISFKMASFFKNLLGGDKPPAKAAVAEDTGQHNFSNILSHPNN